MAAPSFIFSRTFDPSDVDRLQFIITRSDEEEGVLKEGERVASSVLFTTATATIAGLAIPQDSPRTPEIIDTDLSGDPVLNFWFAMTDAAKASTLFAVEQTLLVEFTIVTDSDPSRTRQVTLGIKVQHQ